MQSMNDVNIGQFQFEYDLTWMSFFQNSAGRTYARYGGREDDSAESHLTKASLVRVMNQVLDLHRNKDVKPVSRYEPLPKTARTPEDIPTTKAMLARRKQSKCIHCHDVKVARLKHLRNEGTLKKEMIYTYPSPKNLGIEIDPHRQDVIRSIVKDSAAEKAGLKNGDVIQTAAGHRILTFGDFSRVLELAKTGERLPIAVKRGAKSVETQVQLAGEWRHNSDASWRSSTGPIGPGSGMWGVPATASARKQLGLTGRDLAMRVTVVWARWAKATGVRNGDTIIEFDGQTHSMGPRQLHLYLQLNRNWGDTVPFVVMRGNKRVKLSMTFPTEPPN